MGEVVMICAREGCEVEFEPNVPHQKYCSDNCRKMNEHQRSRRKFEEKECVICGGTFTPKSTTNITCSPTCSTIRTNQRREAKDVIDPVDDVRRRELASYESKLKEGVGKTKILADLLLSSVARINESVIKPAPPIKATRDPETMVVIRSDLHPGILTPSYNLETFHRRMRLFRDKVCLIHSIISKTIPIKRIVVINAGDLVSGQGIFPNQAWKSQCHVLEQIYHHAAPEMLDQTVTWAGLVDELKEVYVPGNHGRTGKDMPDEVNFDTVLAMHIQTALENVKRVSVDVEWDWFRIIEIEGWRFLAMHGNNVRGWMNIPFYGLINKGMRWQGSMPDGAWDYLVHGHFHTPFCLPWNQFEIIGNGTIVSDDEFGLRELGMSGKPAQQVFGVHPEHGVTWRYTLDLR